ncbi:N-carbamoylputrescine amidase [Candidatus Rhodobacter oscarellae]|uniref:N-carbamoylputrescine amidase n=1 Tax=Candidatus Rhodobacter oscarellae TaxID=1675527 RepID=A0A0J9GZY4_9RHOB|nr:N-carbamoylputrescine amidase [Candidatus Rhodobacter lobularis]KMW59048.1 N-carbamoylputrescine amidase [Candidatus Rhodobacter lobularis]
MRKVTVAATQMACSADRETNIAKAEALVRQAAAQGANVILLQELFEGLYFCQNERYGDLARAAEAHGHPTIRHFQALAKELGVVLPVSFYEKAGPARFNSIAILDADGAHLGTYRKSHIPHGAGYQEKFYFSPGDTGFRVWDTAFGRIGVGICWDQWFPESARAMALMGAELLFFPTAIGSEIGEEDWDSAPHWQRVQQGHAGANLVPLIASNRVGTEHGDGTEMTFYGASFIADQFGAKLAEADRASETVLTHSFDLDECAKYRDYWGVFRDRRPELYHPLMTMTGEKS